MSPSAVLPASLDLSHHVTPRVRKTTPSAMKALGKLLWDPKILSLAGGMPHKTLFPMAAASYTIPSAESLAGGDVEAWVKGEAGTEVVNFGKMGPGLFAGYEEGVLDLAQVLQYGLTNGFSETIEPLKALNKLVHGLPYSDAEVYLTLGCTDGVSKSFLLFCEPGDTVLCEEYSFSSSLASGRAKGVIFYPIRMDADGMLPEDLDRVMTTWEEGTMGKRPHMVYTIPCGQNPTGSVPSEERYQAIYRLAQKHDLIIMEDDPYFPLQYKDYEPDKTSRDAQIAAARTELPELPEDKTQDDVYAVARCYNEYAGVKSYYSRDVDGRVCRLDTFSKVAGPGLRLGWISCNSMFVDRFCRVGETSTQVPNNLSQSLVASILSPKHWGLGGWLRWCFSVRLEYQAKRDFFLDTLRVTCNEEFVTTVPARGGMFQWLRIHVEKHPRYVSHAAVAHPSEDTSAVATISEDVPPPTTNTGELLQELWDLALKNNVLVLPGKFFAVQKMDGSPNVLDTTPFLRTTFAGNIPEIEKALTVFGQTIDEFFADGKKDEVVGESFTETAI